MIRRLHEADTLELLTFLYQESAFNIFPIGDVETFGIETDFLHVYGDYHNNVLESILLIYYHNAIYYSIVESVNTEFIQLLSDYSIKILSGKESLISRFIPLIEYQSIKTTYFSLLTKLSCVDDEKIPITHLSTEEEAGALFDFLKKIDEFSDFKTDREEFIKEKMHALKMGITLLAYENNQLVATASSTATTTKSTMIVGVATDSAYRRKGYATALLKALVTHYVNEGKECCLFFDNLEAGRIYERLGFSRIGRWTMIQR